MDYLRESILEAKGYFIKWDRLSEACRVMRGIEAKMVEIHTRLLGDLMWIGELR